MLHTNLSQSSSETQANLCAVQEITVRSKYAGNMHSKCLRAPMHAVQRVGVAIPFGPSLITVEICYRSSFWRGRPARQRELIHERLGVQWQREHAERALRRCGLALHRSSRRAISQGNHVEALFTRTAHGRLYATIRKKPSKGKRLDTMQLQLCLQVRARKGVEPLFAR